MENINLNQKPVLVDSHEDIAWNMLTFQRDYRLSASQIRQSEKGSIIPVVNGDTMLGWPEYEKVNLALIFATLFAAPVRAKEGDWDVLTYKNSLEAGRLYRDQMDAYRQLTDENPQLFRAVFTRCQLNDLLSLRNESAPGEKKPVGFVYLMEGADAIQEADEVIEWFESGVRIFGPAWYSTKYCGGTTEPGPLTQDGVRLVKAIEGMDSILDISHMDERSVLDTYNHFHGKIIASHINPLTLMRSRASNRFLSDGVIIELAERGGVLGVVPYNLFLDPQWKKGDPRENVSLSTFVDHIDYICQLLGNADHVGIGSDFDGGFGYQSTPFELDDISDMSLVIPLLEKKGYTHNDIARIFGINWLEYLQKNLPD